MHVDPDRRPEIAQIITGGVEKLLAQGVGRRTALRRIARKHGVNPRSVSVLIARFEPGKGGLA